MLVILDRDGVINVDSSEYIKSPQEWQPIPHSLEAIARLNKAGHRVMVATNQSGIGRGYFSHQTLRAIHKKMTTELAALGGQIDQIYYCPHLPEEQCSCRKPKPGMLIKIAEEFSENLQRAYFVGDSLRDVQAARLAGCRPVLVLTGKGKETLASCKEELSDIPVYAHLNEFVHSLIGSSR